jgi:hypothetical protein
MNDFPRVLLYSHHIISDFFIKKMDVRVNDNIMTNSPAIQKGQVARGNGLRGKAKAKSNDKNAGKYL